jgi:threonine dehydratase
MSANETLRRILNARVYDVATESALEPAPRLSARLGNRILLKREDQQSIFSFKLRGAYNKMVGMDKAVRARGVIAASAGNHAQGLALAAQRLGGPAVIVMPVTTPSVKVDAVRVRGAEVVLFGDSFSDAYAHALELQAARGLTFVHPFDDPDVIAGQGTVGMEILRQHHIPEFGPLHAIFVPIGGGGLIAGVAAYVKAVQPGVKVIGVQTLESNAMAQSLAAGRRVMLTDVGLFSDGTAVRQVGEHTFALCQQFVDEVICVDTDALCAAIKDVYQDTRTLLEPAGALAIAGCKHYVEREGVRDQNLVAIASGANMNFDRMRFVAERAEVGEQREALYAVTLPEERGSFRSFCGLLGTRSVTEFNYRISDSRTAHIFVGIQVDGREDARRLAGDFSAAGFATLDLTDDELAKLHLRHLVGGRSALAVDEQVFRFEFPERPGALMRFLTSMSPNWNISLFHYRNQGSDYGRILVGLQAPAQDADALKRFVAELGFAYQDETQSSAYRLFLGQ